MVASKKRAGKAKTAKAAKRPAKSRTTLGLGAIDCMKLEYHGSSLCLKSSCEGDCKVTFRVTCGRRFMQMECRWDGRQWVCNRADNGADN